MTQYGIIIYMVEMRVKECMGEEKGEGQPLLLTIKEAMLLLRISHPTVYRMLREGAFRSTMVRGQRRIFYEDVMKYLEERTE